MPAGSSSRPRAVALAPASRSHRPAHSPVRARVTATGSRSVAAGGSLLDEDAEAEPEAGPAGPRRRAAMADAATETPAFGATPMEPRSPEGRRGGLGLGAGGVPPLDLSDLVAQVGARAEPHLEGTGVWGVGRTCSGDGVVADGWGPKRVQWPMQARVAGGRP
jgi:hypothetical protein